MGMMSVAMTGMVARTGIAESRHGRRAATRREQVTAGLARLLYLLMAISGAGVVFSSAMSHLSLNRSGHYAQFS